MQLRSPHVNKPLTWGTWGGKVDKHEDFEEAARREFVEETGYGGTIDVRPAYVFHSLSRGLATVTLWKVK